MNRLPPHVPQVGTGYPITAALWNSFVYAAGFHMRAPSALLMQSITQSVASGTSTKILFDMAARDTEGGHDPANNSSRYTVKTAGTYLVTVAAGMFDETPDGGQAAVTITVNNAVNWAVHLLARDNGAGTFIGACASADIPLQIGDYVEAGLYQDSGQASTTGSTSYAGPWLGLHWVGV